MPNSPKGRPLRLPGPGFELTRIPRTRQPLRRWFRVHQTVYSPRYFSLNAGHRFSHENSPYPVLYLGVDVDTCLFERFGDEIYDSELALPQSLWSAHSLATVKIPEIVVCDLTRPQTLSALKVDLTALVNENLEIPQAWGLAIQKHPAKFQGIKYKSRFNDKACLAVFRRDDIAGQISGSVAGALSTQDEAVDWLARHRVKLY
jgi:hypothetical protein